MFFIGPPGWKKASYKALVNAHCIYEVLPVVATKSTGATLGIKQKARLPARGAAKGASGKTKTKRRVR